MFVSSYVHKFADFCDCLLFRLLAILNCPEGYVLTALNPKH